VGCPRHHLSRRRHRDTLVWVSTPHPTPPTQQRCFGVRQGRLLGMCNASNQFVRWGLHLCRRDVGRVSVLTKFSFFLRAYERPFFTCTRTRTRTRTRHAYTHAHARAVQMALWYTQWNFLWPTSTFLTTLSASLKTITSSLIAQDRLNCE
jgi:hypothetical protein